MPSESYKFAGFVSPNSTQVPDALFDQLLAQLSGAELKVLLYIIRRTFGFKKDADNISLNQICHGICTKDGRVLDQGTGLSQSTVLTAVKGLLKKEIILATRRISRERGNEPTTYTLNFGTPFTENRGRGGTKIEEGLPRKSGTQQTVLQETDKQQHGGVVEELTELGVTRAAAERIVQTYAHDHIRAKLDLVRWLVESHSPLVEKNPAGYLRRALEDNYQPPPGYKSPQQRQADERRRQQELEELAELERVEQEQRREQEAEREREREAAIQVLTKDHPPQQIEGTDLTTQTAWQMALEGLKGTMSASNYHTWLADTVLITCGRSRALIVAPSRFVAEHLGLRFSMLVKKQLHQVLGFSPERIDYLAMTELQTAPPTSPPAGTTSPP
jgi:hypothetical protein